MTAALPTRAPAAEAAPGSVLATYARLVAARVRSDLQYRASFVMFVAGQTLVAGLDLAVILVIFTQVTELAGWSRDEVILLYAMAGISFGLADLFVSQAERASTHIKAGTFDQFLIRPVGVLWQLSAHEFAPRRIGRTLVPLAFLPIALAHVSVDWSPAHVLLVPVTLVSGTVIFGAIWVGTSALSFWTIDSQEIANSFTYGGSLLTQYPLEILAPWLRHIVTFVVPLAFVCYFPCAELLGKDEPAVLAYCAPVVAVASALVARALWRTAIRHYRSTGS